MAPRGERWGKGSKGLDTSKEKKNIKKLRGKRSKEWEAHSLETEAGIGLTALCCSVVSDSLQPHGLQSARLFCPWDSPGKNTEVPCHAFLQGIFPTQGLNPGLLHCRLTLYHPSHQASKLGTYFKCRVVTRKSRFLWYGMIITVAISAVACSSETFEMCLKLFYLFYFSIRKWKKVKSLSHVWLLWPHGLQPTRLLCPWDFPGKSTGVGCHFLLQEIFPTQGLNPTL